jgi:hypothetical protein
VIGWFWPARQDVVFPADDGDDANVGPEGVPGEPDRSGAAANNEQGAREDEQEQQPALGGVPSGPTRKKRRWFLGRGGARGIVKEGRRKKQGGAPAASDWSRNTPVGLWQTRYFGNASSIVMLCAALVISIVMQFFWLGGRQGIYGGAQQAYTSLNEIIDSAEDLDADNSMNEIVTYYKQLLSRHDAGLINVCLLRSGAFSGFQSSFHLPETWENVNDAWAIGQSLNKSVARLRYRRQFYRGGPSPWRRRIVNLTATEEDIMEDIKWAERIGSRADGGLLSAFFYQAEGGSSYRNVEWAGSGHARLFKRKYWSFSFVASEYEQDQVQTPEYWSGWTYPVMCPAAVRPGRASYWRLGNVTVELVENCDWLIGFAPMSTELIQTYGNRYEPTPEKPTVLEASLELRKHLYPFLAFAAVDRPLASRLVCAFPTSSNWFFGAKHCPKQYYYLARYKK